MGGDQEFFTAWIPLHDCPVEVGPLRIVEGSHRFGVQEHQSENLHIPEIPIGAHIGDLIGAGRGGRTPTRLPSADFETVEASSSPAQNHMHTATYETSSFGSVRLFEGL